MNSRTVSFFFAFFCFLVKGPELQTDRGPQGELTFFKWFILIFVVFYFFLTCETKLMREQESLSFRKAPFECMSCVSVEMHLDVSLAIIYV